MDKMNYNAPSVYTATTPSMQADDGTVSLLNTTASVFMNVGTEAHKRQLNQDLDRAMTEGAKIGYEVGKDFKPIRNGSLFARQFNRYGLASAGQKVSIHAHRRIRELSEQNPANPDGLRQALEAWHDGYVQDLPEEMQGNFSINFESMAVGAIDKAIANRKVLDGQIAAAEFYEYERETQKAMEALAPMAFRVGPEGDSARAALATMRQNYAESLIGNGPEGEYEVGGYKVKSVPGRSGAFNPLEIQKKLRGFDNMMIEAGAYGYFQDEVEAGRGVEAYMNFAKGNMEISTVTNDGKLESVRIGDVLTNDEMDGLAGKMRSFIGGLNSIEEGEHRKWERSRARYNDSVTRQAYRMAMQVEEMEDGTRRIVGGDPVALQNMIANALNDPNVEPATIGKLQELANDLGSGQIDNPLTVNETMVGIATGAINSYQDVPKAGVSDATRVKMYESIDQRLKGEHWSKSTRYSIAEQYADSILAPEKSSGFTFMGDPNSESVANRAEWNRRMIEETLAAEAAGVLPANPNARPGQGEFDFVATGKQIADEIAARKNKPASPELQSIDNEIAEVEKQMNDPKPDASKAEIEQIKQRYRELQQRRNRMQTNQLLGIQ